MDAQRKGFTLIEIMAVVMIISIMVGIAMVTFSRSRPSVKVRNDAAQTLSFLRNMWDRTRATGAPLILKPDYENGSISYIDMRSNREEWAQFSKDTMVIGILINDRFYNADSALPLPDSKDGEGGQLDEFANSDVIYISEGRALTRVGVVFGIAGDKDSGETWEHLHMSSLNLITGKGHVGEITLEELESLMHEVHYQNE